MTYISRGRSLFEFVVSLAFVAFLIGFVLVLCIGNVLRARRAQIRQAERRKIRTASSPYIPTSYSYLTDESSHFREESIDFLSFTTDPFAMDAKINQRAGAARANEDAALIDI